MSPSIYTHHSTRAWLWAAFSLKPYGVSLLSPGANLWIGFVRLIVGALALVEGVSWAYVGNLAGGTSGWLSWVFALTLGAIIFVFVWAVDVSLMSLDLDAHQRKSAGQSAPATGAAGPSGETAGPGDAGESDGWTGALPSGARSWREYLRWPVLPVGIRSALVVLSVVVTAPFISMYVLRAEISHELDNRFQTSLERVKAEKQTLRGQQEAQQQEALKTLRGQVQTASERYEEALKAYRLEVSGRGASGRYGDGAAAKASLLVAERLKVELDAQLTALENFTKNLPVLPAQADIDAIEKAALDRDFVTLRIRFGIEDVPDSFVARSKVVTEKFAGTEEFKRVERSVWSLLSFLAGALFLLKYFQPDTVLIYFSEARQAQWHEYLNGTYDYLLKPEDQSARHRGGRPLAPQYFRKLWDETIAPALSDKEFAEAQARVIAVEEKHRVTLQEYESLIARDKVLSSEMPAREQEHLALSAQRQRVHEQVQQVQNTIHAVTKMAAQEGQSAAVNELPGLETRKDALTQQVVQMDATLATLATDIQGLKAEQYALRQRKSVLDSELANVLDLRQQLNHKQRDQAAASIGRVKVG